MTIALIQAAAQKENIVGAASLVLDYPVGMDASSFMVLGMASAVATPPALPLGWTQVFRSSSTGGTAAPSALLCIKQAAGETGTLSVSYTSSTAIGQILAFSGVDLTNPQDVTFSLIDTGTSTGNSNIPGVTTSRPGCMGVYLACQNSIANTATPPSGFTETADKTGTGQRSGTMGYGLFAAAGPTASPIQVAWSASARGIGMMLVLRPAPSAAPPQNSNFLMFG